jgi:hypothetical protein
MVLVQQVQAALVMSSSSSGVKRPHICQSNPCGIEPEVATGNVSAYVKHMSSIFSSSSSNRTLSSNHPGCLLSAAGSVGQQQQQQSNEDNKVQPGMIISVFNRSQLQNL